MTNHVIVRNDALFIKHDKGMIAFDKEGKFRYWFDTETLVRRGLDHQFLIKEVERDNNERTIHRRRLTTIEIPDWEEKIEAFIDHVFTHPSDCRLEDYQTEKQDRSSLERVQQLIKAWPFEQLKAHGELFSKIYKPVSILPPDQYGAVVLQISEGCSYNKCTFCNFYRDRPFRIKGIDETRQHIQAVKKFFGEDLSRRKTLFLGDANAIIIPQKRLLQLLEVVESEFTFNEHEPQGMEGIYAFMDVFGLQWKTVEELAELKKHHLKTVYIGLETGDDDLREFIAKQGKAHEVKEQIHRLKEAGLQVGVIVMIGVGGQEFRESHRIKTVELIKQLQLDKKDLVYLSPFVAHQDLPYVKDMSEAGYVPLTSQMIDEEMKRFKDELKEVTDGRISHYYIEEFIY